MPKLSPVRRAAWSRTTRYAAVVAVLALAGFRANAAPPARVQWEDLPRTAAGKVVLVAMPEGAVITGKVTGVTHDALLVNIRSTTDAKACPKGPASVPRATLRMFQMQTKGKVFRIVFTPLASVAGLVAGVFAAWGVQGGILNTKHEGKAAAAFFGIWAGATVGGYFAGNAADKRWTAVEIAQ